MFNQDPNKGDDKSKQQNKPSLFGGSSMFGDNNSKQPSLFGNSPATGGLFGGNSAPPSLFQGISPAPSSSPSPGGLFSGITGGSQPSMFSSQDAKKDNKPSPALQKKSEISEKSKEEAAPQAKQSPKAPLLSFGGGQGGSLFGSSSGKQEGGLFGVSMFGNKAQPAEQPSKKKQEQGPKNTESPSGGLFGGKGQGQLVSLFGNPSKNIAAGTPFAKKEDKGIGEPTSKPSQPEVQVKSSFLPPLSKKPEQKQQKKEQSQPGQSLFQNIDMTKSMFMNSKKPEQNGKAGDRIPSFMTESKTVEKGQSKGLFGPKQPSKEGDPIKKMTFSGFGSSEGSSAPLFGVKPIPTDKKQDIIPAPPHSVKKDTLPNLNALDPQASVQFSFAKSSQEEKKDDKKQAQPQKAEQPKPSTFGGSLFSNPPEPPKPKIATPTATETRVPAQSKQSPAGSNLPEFPPSNVDQRKRQFAYPETKEGPKTGGTVTTGPESDKKDTQKAPSELRSARQTHSVTINEPSAPHSEVRRPTTQASRSRQAQPSYFSTVRPREVASKNFIDYKTLNQEQSTSNFQIFFSQKKGDIIQSIKIYFSVRQGEHKAVEIPSDAKDRDRFYKDFANLLVKELRVESAHFEAVQSYIRKFMTDEKYDQVMFNGDSFSPGYFSLNAIYWRDYKGNYLLNESSSPELRRLSEKLIQRWFEDKLNYIRFIYRNPELISPKEDLFSYLFKALLKQETTHSVSDKGNSLTGIVKDYTSIASDKLIQLLELYNSKMGRNYKLLTDDPDKFIIGTLPLIQHVSNQNELVIRTYLRLVLTAMRLNQAERLSNQLARALRETKSMALLPLRVIVSKLKQGKVDFAPSAEDLYKYIKGDEWVDWIEAYLSSNRQSTELIFDQPAHLVESICSISGERLLDKLMSAKKGGIFKFFELLKEENYTDYIYRILESCLHNEESIRQVDQFYFKKDNFNIEFQQIVEYIVNFHENLGKEAVFNEEHIFNSISSKMSLLAKIFIIDPEKIFEIEKHIFYPQHNPNKRINYENGEGFNREGHKIVQVLVDILKIVALKGLAQGIVPKIIRAATSLLKNRRTEPIVLAVTNITEPCLASLGSQLFTSQMWQALSAMLDQLLSCSYVEDLVIVDNSNISPTNYQIFYPLRYNNTQFGKLMQSEQTNLSQTFSLKWLDQLFSVAARQPFQASLANKLLTKLHIIPPESSSESSSSFNYGIRRYSNSRRNVPKVLEMIASLLNHYNIWEEISRVLTFKIHRQEGKLTIINEHSHSPYHSTEQSILHNHLQLLSTIFRLSNIIVSHQQKSPCHFAIKALASVNVLNRVSVRTTISQDQNKNYLLLGLMSCIEKRQSLKNDSNQSIVLQAEETEEDETRNRRVLAFLQNSKSWLDFDQGSNFLRQQLNPHFLSLDNITTLALENILYYLQMCPNSCLQYSLQTVQALNIHQKTQLKTDMVGKLKQILKGYLSSSAYAGIHHKLVSFVVDLKYKLPTRINQGLADGLMLDVLKIQNKNWDSKVHHLLLRFMSEEIKDKKQSSHFQRLVEGQILDFVSTFDMKSSVLAGHHPIADIQQLTDIILKYHDKQYSLLNFNQFERLIEQKAIIDIGLQLQALANVIDIVLTSLASRKYSLNLKKTLNHLNKLVADKNLILMQNDIPFEYGHSRGDEPTLAERLTRPRTFLRDPYEMFLSHGKTLDKKKEIQTFQKNNIIEWLLEITEKTSQKLTSYLQFVLTIDRSFYANNPLIYQTTRNDLAKKELFCHLSLGSTPFKAVQIFGSKESDAVGVVELIAQNLLDRVGYLHEMVSKAGSSGTSEQSLYQEGVHLLGFCLEWLRHKKNSSNQPAGIQMSRRVSQRYHSLLPPLACSLLNSQQLKVLQSYLSLGEKIPNTIKYDIHHHIYAIMEKYLHSKQATSKAEDQDEVALLLQQAFSVLMVCPPQCNESAILDSILRIWHSENNDRYFYNQARLILELAYICPDELAKFSPLTKCKSIGQNTLDSRYINHERTPSSLSWLWGIKIASALASNSQSVLAVEEAGQFMLTHKTKIQKILQGAEQHLSRGYLQDLQGVLQLIVALFSHSLWVTNNGSYMQEITYLMSHHLIKLFIGIAQGRLVPVALSKNEQVLSEVRGSNEIEESRLHQHGESMLSVELKVRTVNCLKVFCLAMQKAFKISEFDHKHFKTAVMGPSRYLSSFWDTFNKNIIVLFNFSISRTEYWLKSTALKSVITMLNQCYKAPHTFYANGYLPTIIELPQNENELIGDHYLLTYLLGELAVVHCLKQRNYNTLYNALMVGHTDTFAKRIKEHLSRASELGSKLPLEEYTDIGEEHFRQLERIL